MNKIYHLWREHTAIKLQPRLNERRKTSIEFEEIMCD